MFIRSLHLSSCRHLKNKQPFSLVKKIRSKRGSEMVEAAICVPVLILTAMLLIRMFTFYLEILSTGINEHMSALEAWDSYNGAGFRKYSSETEVKMLRGGLLRKDLTKVIKTRTYLINEDLLVRAGEAFE